jgi:hypothetical protein
VARRGITQVRITETATTLVKGYRSYVHASLACVAVGAALAPVVLAGLVGWPFAVPRAIQQLGLAVGLGTYFAWRVCARRASSGTYVAGAAWPLGLAPTLLLIEGGVAGFLGFSSDWRYVPLVVAAWGAIRLVRTLLSVLYLGLLAKRD